MRPIFRIEAEGQDITELIQERLVELSLKDTVGFESDTLDLILHNAGGVIARPRRGAQLQCWLGYQVAGQEQLYYKGAFYVDELSESASPDQLSIHAKAADMLSSAKVLKTRSFQQTTLGAVLETLAADEGLQLAVSSAYRSIVLPWLLQQDESNLALLTRLGQQYGAVATVKNKRLVFVPQGSMTTASGQPMPAIEVKLADCSGWDYQELGRGEYTGAVASWRNDEGQSGQVQQGSVDVPWVIKTLFDSEDQATDAAKAELKRLNGDSNTLSLSLAHANPALCAEAQIQVTGLRPYIDAQVWVVKDVSLTLSASSGFSGSVECVRPAALEEDPSTLSTPIVDPKQSKLINPSGFPSLQVPDQVFRDIYSAGVAITLPAWPAVVRYLARDFQNGFIQSGELLPLSTLTVLGNPSYSHIGNASFQLYGVDQDEKECYLGSVSWQVIRPS